MGQELTRVQIGSKTIGTCYKTYVHWSQVDNKSYTFRKKQANSYKLYVKKSTHKHTQTILMSYTFLQREKGRKRKNERRKEGSKEQGEEESKRKGQYTKRSCFQDSPDT